MAETLRNDQETADIPQQVGSAAIAASLEAPPLIPEKLIKRLSVLPEEGEASRKRGALVSIIKEDFQKTLAAPGERESLEAQARERNTRKVFRSYGLLDNRRNPDLKPTEQEAVTRAQADAFSLVYKQAEAQADGMDKQRLMELLDAYEGHPVIRTFDAVRDTSPYRDSAVKMLRTSLILLNDYAS